MGRVVIPWPDVEVDIVVFVVVVVGDGRRRGGGAYNPTDGRCRKARRVRRAVFYTASPNGPITAPQRIPGACGLQVHSQKSGKGRRAVAGGAPRWGARLAQPDRRLSAPLAPHSHSVRPTRACLGLPTVSQHVSLPAQLDIISCSRLLLCPIFTPPCGRCVSASAFASWPGCFLMGFEKIV